MQECALRSKLTNVRNRRGISKGPGFEFVKGGFEKIVYINLSIINPKSQIQDCTEPKQNLPFSSTIPSSLFLSPSWALLFASFFLLSPFLSLLSSARLPDSCGSYSKPRASHQPRQRQNLALNSPLASNPRPAPAFWQLELSAETFATRLLPA